MLKIEKEILNQIDSIILDCNIAKELIQKYGFYPELTNESVDAHYSLRETFKGHIQKKADNINELFYRYCENKKDFEEIKEEV